MFIFKKKSLFMHLSLTFFLFSILLSFLTSRSTEIPLNEVSGGLTAGSGTSINDVYKKLGISEKSNIILYLDRFEIDNLNNYCSYLTMIGHNKTNKATVLVNKPIKIESIIFYQKSWSIGFRDLSFTFGGKTNGLAGTKEKLITKDGDIFRFKPAGLSEGKIIYEWSVFRNSDIVKKGYYPGEENNDKELFSEYGFSILKEDYYFTSILMAAYHPNDWLTAFWAVIYLTMLAFSLAGKGREGSLWQ